MKKTIIIGFCLLFVRIVTAQVVLDTLIPEKQISLGNHLHTSRDELVAIEHDKEGNIFLLGFIEDDTAFADVVLQKLDVNGQILWHYRFDSNHENNYDVPLQMGIDSSGGVTVFGLSSGIVSFFSPQRSSGFLFKIDKEGHLAWQVGLDTLLPKHDAAWHSDGFMDASGCFHICYSAVKEFGSRPTYFIKFGPDGKILQSFQKYNIAQKLGGGGAAFGQTRDANNNFVFSIYEDDPNFTGIRKINPYTGQDQSIRFDLSALKTTEINNMGLLGWTDLRIDESSAVYSANDVGFPLGPTVVLTKIEANGKIVYVQRYDSSYIYLAAFEAGGGFVYLAGSYIATKSGRTVAFLWKIDQQGKTVKALAEEGQQHDQATRFLLLRSGLVYWATQDLSTGVTTLKMLDAATLTVQWQYAMVAPTEYIFTGINILPADGGKIIFGGTLYREKQPGSAYLSEAEWFVETFTPATQQSYNTYLFTERGTSYIEDISFSTMFDGKIVASTEELDGPEYAFIQYAPRRHYYYLLSKDLELIWKIESKYPQYGRYGLAAFYFDQSNNIYTFEHWGADSLLLQKISPKGEYLASYPILNTGIGNLFIDHQNRIHLVLLSVEGMSITVLNNDLKVIEQQPNFYSATHFFQMPGTSAAFSYREQRESVNGKNYTHLSLFKDSALVWKRSFSFDFQGYSFSNLDIHPESGNLLALLIEDNLREITLHSFSLNNEHKTVLIKNNELEGVFYTAQMSNGNIFIAYETKLELYDRNLQLLKTIPFKEIGGGYYFHKKDILYRQRYGVLYVYNETGQAVLDAKNKLFGIDPNQNHVSADWKHTVAGTHGELFGVGYAYGWRWFRGLIQRFDLSNYLLTSSTTPLPLFAVSSLHCFPTPASDQINLDATPFQGKNIAVGLQNIGGSLVFYNQYENIQEAVVRIKTKELPAGIYIVTVETGEKRWSKKVVIQAN